jgi:hypothetical protein
MHQDAKAWAATQHVLAQVRYERQAQDAKWGEQNGPDGTGDDRHLFRTTSRDTYGTLCYLAKSATDRHAAQGDVTFADILAEEVFEALSALAVDELRAELVQVAAVAVAWVEAIDRRAGA